MFSPQLGSRENWNSLFLVQVTTLSPLSSCPTLQLRYKTVPAGTGNCLSTFITAEQEARSIQLWNKKERFLRRKKHEETIPSSAVPSYSEINYFLSSSDEESC